MVTDGKENYHPNPSQRHEFTTNVETDNTNKSTILGDFPFGQLSTISTDSSLPQRPLLFSEILFNNGNGNHFSVTCTSSSSTSSSETILR